MRALPLYLLLFLLLFGYALGVRADNSAHPTVIFDGVGEFAALLCREAPHRVTASFCQMDTRQIRLVGPQGEEIRLDVLVAASVETRSAGYQFIHPDVIANSAILFLFETESSGAFHMCNVAAPLDILWIRADGRILDAQLMLPGEQRHPALCRSLYAPARFGLYRYALEVPAGLLAEHGFSLDRATQWRLLLDE